MTYYRRPRPPARALMMNWRKIKPPSRAAKRPRDLRGFIIPYSVDDGTTQPDFRVTQMERVRQLLESQGCWICGLKRERTMCFIGGPLSIINHLFTDGWVHFACGVYALRVCPFLARPQAEYSQRPVPNAAITSDYVAAKRPDEFGLAFTTTFSTLLDPDGGLILKAGSYKKVHWYSVYGNLLRVSSGKRELMRRSIESKFNLQTGVEPKSTARVQAFRDRQRAAKAARTADTAQAAE